MVSSHSADCDSLVGKGCMWGRSVVGGGRNWALFLSACPTGTVDGASTGDAFLLYARQVRCKMLQRRVRIHR